MTVDGLHRSTQGPLLRRRLRRPRPAHRTRAPPVAPRSATDRATLSRSLARLDRERRVGSPPVRRLGDGRAFLTDRGCRASARNVRARPPTATRGSSSATSSLASATSRCAAFAPSTSTTSTSISSPPAADRRAGLAPKTVHEVHLIIRSALDLAVRSPTRRPQRRPRHPLADGGAAVTSRRPDLERRRTRRFLEPRRIAVYPALHLAAHTGMRRGEIVGLRWTRPRPRHAHGCRSAARSRTSAAKPTEFGAKTRTSRRTSTSTTTRSDSSCGGVGGSTRPAAPRPGRLDVLQHRPAATSTRSRSANSSLASFNAATSHASASMTYDTPTPRFSSPTASRSRSSPNGSATPTRRSRCTPTSTCSRA